jgi:hypothetical protein
MNSYGYKVPGLQDRIARQRQFAPGTVFEEPSAEGIANQPQPIEPGDVFGDPSPEDVVPATAEPVAPRPTQAWSPTLAPARPTSPREFFESQILPQVREVLGDYGVQNAYAEQQRQNSERTNLQRIEEADREALNRLRGTPVPSSVQLPEPISYQGLGSAGGYLGSNAFQPGIPGLFSQVEGINDELEQLRSQRTVEAFDGLLTKYPELDKVLLAEPELKGKASRVRKAGFNPYLNYVDKEQVFSSPEDRAALYNQILSESDSLAGEAFAVSDVADALRRAESDYTSGETDLQTGARDFLRNILQDPADLDRIENSAFRENRPVIGGGGYVPVQNNPLVQRINQRAKEFNDLYDQLNAEDRKQLAQTYPGLRKTQGGTGSQGAFYLDPDTREVSLASFDDPEAYAVDVNRYVPSDISLMEVDKNLLGSEISKNALRFLADYPVTANTSVSFSTREPGYRDTNYGAKVLPPELVNPVSGFVADTAFSDLRPGTLVTNSPLSSSDLLDKRVEEGKTKEQSSTLRRLQPFVDANSQLPNLRGLAYTSAGFGPVSKTGTQVSYVDDKGQAIPIQLERTEVPLRGIVAVRDAGDASVFQPALPASATPRYYAADPVSGALAGGAEVLRNLRRTPSALLPGAADLIPSPEAIRTGYAQGPVEMGKQMAQEFAQSLPTAAGSAMLLSTPVLAPFAPGIGAGMVGVAGTQALNEVVRQETGEGIVPKVRQFLGTAPRTGVSAPARQGEKPLVAQIKPLTEAQRTQMNKNQTRTEMQRRMDLARERFNPRKGEFGLSELLFGR